MATGGAPLLLVDQVCEQLTGLLSLSACRFQDGTAGLGGPPRLRRDGQVLAGGQIWDAGRDGLPRGTSTELLAEASGLLQGRFLLTPGPRAPITLEQRLVAVALATSPEPPWPASGWPPAPTAEDPGLVQLKTAFAGTRIVDLLVSDSLPRVC